MMLKNKKILYRLLGGFSLIILLATAFGMAAINYLSTTSEITAQLYKHPFTVATEVLRADASIVAMHRSMKDVVLAENESAVQEAIKIVENYENSVYESFDLIKERFLGDSAQIDQTLRTIDQWRPIRKNVIRLFKEGKRLEAVAITRGQGSQHVEKIQQEMNALVEFAESKALAFMQQGLDKGQNAIQWMSGFLLLVFALATLIAIATTLGITLPLRRITAEMKLIADGGEGTGLTEVDRKDELGGLAVAAENFKQAVQESKQLNANLQRQHWVRSNISELVQKFQTSKSPQELYHTVISFLVRLLESGHGVIYLYEDESEQLKLHGAFGLEKHQQLKSMCKLGEGLVGQCGFEKLPITLTDVPTDYIKITSGLGEATPLQITVLPVLYKEKLLSVIEIGSFRLFSELQKQFLNEVMPTLALNLENFLNSQKTMDLLETTTNQAEELKASAEEQRISDKELRTSNEELREKAELLNIQSQELKASEEEQRVINAELSEKNRLLDQQKEALTNATSVAEERALELEQSNRYKTEFLANMSHELRTPLNSLLILSKSMAANELDDLSPDHVESAKIIYESGSELLRLINDILDLSKIEAGKMIVMLQPCLTESLAKSLRRQFAHVAAGKNIEFGVNLEEGLPAEFVTDENKLRQILSNLISNAIKFTNSGRVSVEIGSYTPPHLNEIVEDVLPANLVFKVSDTGVGIAESNFVTVFEEFKQVDGTASRSYGGTGLGLSIANKMAHLLGGEISLSSKEGEGSEFSLYLPYRPSDRGPGKATENKDSLTARDAKTENATKWKTASNAILVIEDDKRFAKTLGEAAERTGFESLYASDGETGITLAKTHQPRGILLDIGLPDMSGFQVVERLKADSATNAIPIHIISGVGVGDIGQGEKVIGHLLKPVSSDQIDNTIKSLLSHSETSLKNLLIVEDDENARAAIRQLVKQKELSVTEAASAEDALSLLAKSSFDCMVLDLGLPGMSGFEMLKSARESDICLPPVVIYSGRDLTSEESLILRNYTDSIIMKGSKASERLLDEVTLFLHSMLGADVDGQKQALIASGETQKNRFHDETVLLVDDDMRNIFALSKTLRAKGLRILMAKDGEHALKQLDRHSNVDLILMDIMMPGMDGYETMARIREQARFASTPIIAITAKAMSGDREKCISAGANDYLSKPVAIDDLVVKIRRWFAYDQ